MSDGVPPMEPQSAEELALRLRRLVEERGYVNGTANGSQSAGKTLEHLLSVPERHGSQNPDLATGIELKAINTQSSVPTTLLTMEPDVTYRWGKELVEHCDTGETTASNATNSLHASISNYRDSSHRLSLTIHESGDIFVTDVDADAPVARYDRRTFTESLRAKFSHLMRVFFVSKKVGVDPERQDTVFNYTGAEYCYGLDPGVVDGLILDGDLRLDIRMKVRPDGSLRNHGTAWRIDSSAIPRLYESVVDVVDAGEGTVSSLPTPGQTVLVDRDVSDELRSVDSSRRESSESRGDRDQLSLGSFSDVGSFEQGTLDNFQT